MPRAPARWALARSQDPARETDIVRHLVAGTDTRALGIIDHTVTDHLKSIFLKSGTNSRAQLVARITG